MGSPPTDFPMPTMTRLTRSFPIGWILLFGALAAGLLEQVQAFWLGALCGWLFGRLRGVEQEVDALNARLAKASRSIPEAAAEAVVPTSVEPATVEPVTVSAPTAPVTPSVPMIRQSAGWAEPVATVESTSAVPPPTRSSTATASDAARAPAAPSLLDRCIDWAKGGNPLARLGVLITFIGAVYLIRYAAEAGYLPVELRLAGLSAGALAMIGFGWRLRSTLTSYALTLQGGGLALLYLTVLAALRLYQLLPPTFAFALLVIVAGASAGLAVTQNALPLAVIGFAGGFAAPLLLGGDGSHLALFGYYTVLNLGVFAVAAFRGWALLNLLGFVFTFVITSLWRATAYRPEWFASFECFLLLFFAMYVLVTVLSARSGPRRGAVSGTLIFGLPAIVLSLQASLVIDFAHGLAISSAGFGLFYLLVAAGLLRSGREHWQTTGTAFVAIGVVLLTLAVPLYWDDQATAATWALEGAGAVWLGLRQRSAWTRGFGVVIQLLAGTSLLIAIDRAGVANGGLAAGVPGALLLAAAGLFSAIALHRAAPDALTRRERLLPQLTPVWAPIWALGWWLFAGLSQIEHLHSPWATGLALAFGALTVALLAALAHRLVWPWLQRLGHATALLFAIGGMVIALDHRPSYEGGAVGWLLLLAAHYWGLWRSERDAATPPDPAAHVVPALLKVWLGSLELAWHLRDQLGGDWPMLAHGLAPAFALALIAAFPRSWPVHHHARLYAHGVAAPIAAWLLLWIVHGSLYANGNAAPLPTWPLLNPLDLSMLPVAAALVFWWRRRDPVDWQWLARLPMPHAELALVPTLAVIAAFAWANGALVRGLHYAAGTPLKGLALLDSALLQASFSVFWSGVGFGAMWWAARRGLRAVWLVGAALMVVVAIKLFAVDTAGTGTLARITAFLFVGVILLVAGYFAPLPERGSAAASERSD